MSVPTTAPIQHCSAHDAINARFDALEAEWAAECAARHRPPSPPTTISKTPAPPAMGFMDQLLGLQHPTPTPRLRDLGRDSTLLRDAIFYLGWIGLGVCLLAFAEWLSSDPTRTLHALSVMGGLVWLAAGVAARAIFRALD